jgi:hypothetical protein
MTDRGTNTLTLRGLEEPFFQLCCCVVSVQIDLIHFEHTKCICSTSIKTNTYLLHLRSIHTISCKIGHVIQIVPDYVVLIQFVVGQFEQKLIEKSLSLSD